MPLLKGHSRGVIGKNISEFLKAHPHGKSKKKKSKKGARKQAIAVALSQARRSR